MWWIYVTFNAKPPYHDVIGNLPETSLIRLLASSTERKANQLSILAIFPRWYMEHVKHKKPPWVEKEVSVTCTRYLVPLSSQTRPATPLFIVLKQRKSKLLSHPVSGARVRPLINVFCGWKYGEITMWFDPSWRRFLNRRWELYSNVVTNDRPIVMGSVHVKYSIEVSCGNNPQRPPTPWCC